MIMIDYDWLCMIIDYAWLIMIDHACKTIKNVVTSVHKFIA